MTYVLDKKLFKSISKEPETQSIEILLLSMATRMPYTLWSNTSMTMINSSELSIITCTSIFKTKARRMSK